MGILDKKSKRKNQFIVEEKRLARIKKENN